METIKQHADATRAEHAKQNVAIADIAEDQKVLLQKIINLENTPGGSTSAEGKALLAEIHTETQAVTTALEAAAALQPNPGQAARTS